jgi:ElaB/YqjD/DUF883 family membrane-anchored ribosome-binding protein
MEDSIISDLVKNGQALADKAADKVQAGIRDAKHAAGPAVGNAIKRVRSMGREGIDAVGDAAQRTRDAASYASDSIVTYTRKNPVKALLIAAASGAVLLSLLNALKSTRK